MVSRPSKPTASERNVLILGAAGRDFHNFNVVFRDDPAYRVVAFTAAQIPGIADRRYPAELAGPRYPDGIPIEPEAHLEALCRDRHVHEVVFAYSDLPHAAVMHLASRALAVGADFRLLGPDSTMIRPKKPVIAVCGLRTGAGKSPVSRWLGTYIKSKNRTVAVIRHPMPYGNLALERVQRFASLADLTAARCTIEEREEYEPHIAAGTVVFAGVDYAAIAEKAAEEADILIWDGGNNDFSFIRPGLLIAVADALRPDQVDTHHPGETVARMADILLMSKTDAATPDAVAALETHLRAVNPTAPILRGLSPVRLDNPDAVRNRRVLIVEDGPTLTHGGMAYGAGTIAAKAAGARTFADPRPFAASSLKWVFETYPHIGAVLPAIGYDPSQLQGMAETIAASDADVVVSATPIDLAALIKIDKPVVRARYAFAEDPGTPLSARIDAFLAAH